MKTRLKFVTAVVGGCTLAGFAGFVALGYSTAGPTWPSTDVLYYVNATNADISPAAARDAVQQGALAWSTQSDASVQLVYAGSTTATTLERDGQFNVFFRNESNGSAWASAYWWSNSAGEIVDSDIVFWDAEKTFFTGTSGCASGGYVEDLATHEFGHSLGIDHSGISGATMQGSYGTCSTSQRSLSADDIAAVESIYPPTGSSPPPSAPSRLTASANPAQPTAMIDLSWVDTSSNETSFMIERSGDGQNFQWVGQNSQNDTTYTDSSVSSSTAYWYRVKSNNSSGESSPSNVAWAVTGDPDPDPDPDPEPDPDPDPTPDPPTVPSSPSPADGKTYASRDVDLGWSAGANATSYDVYFGQSSSPSLYQAGVTSNGLTLPRLGKNKTYHWRVVSRNSAGSASSSVWWFSTGGGPGAGSPGGGGGRGRGRKK